MRDKETRLAEILNVVTVGQCIVFVHTREAVRLTFTLTLALPPHSPSPLRSPSPPTPHREQVDKLAALLISNGHAVSSLHGRMESTSRDKAPPLHLLH